MNYTFESFIRYCNDMMIVEEGKIGDFIKNAREKKELDAKIERIFKLPPKQVLQHLPSFINSKVDMQKYRKLNNIEKDIGRRDMIKEEKVYEKEIGNVYVVVCIRSDANPRYVKEIARLVIYVIHVNKDQSEKGSIPNVTSISYRDFITYIASNNLIK